MGTEEAWCTTMAAAEGLDNPGGRSPGGGGEESGDGCCAFVISCGLPPLHVVVVFLSSSSSSMERVLSMVLLASWDPVWDCDPPSISESRSRIRELPKLKFVDVVGVVLECRKRIEGNVIELVSILVNAAAYSRLYMSTLTFNVCTRV